MSLPALGLHPLIETGALPVAPAFLATVAVVVVSASAAPAPRRSPVARDPGGYLHEPLPMIGVLGRVVAVALLGLAVVAGLVGVNRSAGNIATALIVGVGWPALVVGCVSFGGLWPSIDPWDGLARGLERLRVAAPDREPVPAADVRWALPAALAGTWYLAAYRDFVQPRAVAGALLVYTVVTLAGCLALGRRRWLASAEPFGLLLRWVSLLPRRALGAWNPPRGAALVLGGVGGGLLFGALRLTEWWGRFAFSYQGQMLDTVGFAVCAAAGAGILGALDRYGLRFRGEGAVVAATVPVVTAIALATSLLGGRLLNAAQLVIPLASDPFGWGWDLFGTAGWRVRPYPVPPGWHVSIQLVLLVAGAVVGARIARTQTGSARADALVPALTGVCVLLAAAVLAVTVL